MGEKATTVIEHHEQPARASDEQPPLGAFVRTLAPIAVPGFLLLALARGSFAHPGQLAFDAALVAAALGGVVWLRARAARPVRATATAEPTGLAVLRDRWFPVTPPRVALAVVVLALALAVANLLATRDRRWPAGLAGWGVGAFTLIVTWCTFMLVLGAVARLGTALWAAARRVRSHPVAP